LKAPGTKRLTQQHDEMLSSIPFKVNLRRYITGTIAFGGAVQVDPIKPTLKARGIKPLKV
jgi:hypothetical protein